MRYRIRYALAVFVAAALLVSGQRIAFADGVAVAKQSYENGRKNYNLSHYEEALKNFEQAYQAKDDPAFLFNIAQCQRALHRYGDAARTYRSYLRESPNLAVAIRDQTQKIIAEMDSASDAEQRQKLAEVQAKQLHDERNGTVVLPAPAPDPQQTAPAGTGIPKAQRGQAMDQAHTRRARSLGIALMVAGAVVAGVGGGLAAYSASTYSQAQRATTLGDSRSLTDRSNTIDAAAWPLVGVGAAAFVGGTVMLSISFGHDHRTERTLASASEGR